MALELVNPDPRYGKVHLIEPAPLGYLHLAADVQAAHRPGPVLRRSRDKHQLLGVLKWQARQLAQLDTVERATVYDALAFTPPGGYVKDRPAPLPPPGSTWPFWSRRPPPRPPMRCAPFDV